MSDERVEVTATFMAVISGRDGDTYLVKPVDRYIVVHKDNVRKIND